jgi:CheY-like chemotaxis protein
MTVLTGRHILVVEDEPLIAMTVEDMIFELGAITVGPAANVAEGLRLAAHVPLDAALLDVNLNGSRSDEIAHFLTRRGIPYIFATGYGRSGIESFPDAPVITKPFRADTLAQMLSALLDGRDDSGLGDPL